jgi:glycosyltransferase involved in cell wall biosynthesis
LRKRRDPVKVLIITKTLAEFANLQGKIREISRLGVDLTVVSPARWSGRDSELKDVRPDGYEFLVCKCWFSGTTSVRLGNHLHLYPGISSIIGREKWDLVHIDEEPFNLATYHALRRCRRHQAPAVFSTWQNLMKKYPPPFNLFEKYVHGNAAGAIAGNVEGLELLRRRGFRGPAARIPLLGVDPSFFRRQDATGLRQKLAPSGSFVVGFVGRIHREKGLDTLVRAIALLPKSSVVVLVGRGPYRAQLEGLIGTLGLSERVRWAPWVNSKEVPEYMSAFDVLVLPSRTRRTWKEQFGRVLVEAMASETCVVGSDSGNIPKVVGDAGLIFQEGDERGLAECLRNLMDDTLLRETLHRRGRQRVLENFTYAKIAADTVNFYRSICSGSEMSSYGERGLVEYKDVRAGVETRA